MRLGVDFGTSNTIGALRRLDGPVAPLLFDSSPLLTSAVLATVDGVLLTGTDAERAALAYPAGYEPNPKRRIDDGTVLLGERELSVVELIAAVLARQWTEACRVAGGPPEQVVLAHPAAWRHARTAVLAQAARQAGLPPVTLVAEPVAAAAYFVSVLGGQIQPGQSLVVYDLGAGTFDVSTVRRVATGFEVTATAGLADVGGLDLDAAVLDHARGLTPTASAGWQRLDQPTTNTDRRARRELWQGARAAKELLSRHARADLHLPVIDVDLHLTRPEFEQAAQPYLDRTVELTHSLLRSAGVPADQVSGIVLVGGSSRIPLVATLLHRRFGIAPTVIDQPELVVAYGCLHVWPAARPDPVGPEQASPRLLAPARLPAPARMPAPPVAARPELARTFRSAPPPPAPPPPAPGGIPPRGVLPRDFPVHLVEVTIENRTGYTVRSYVADEDGLTEAVFASVEGRLPLFRRPERASDFAAGAEHHDLCAVLHWEALSDAMAQAFLPLIDGHRYDLDLPSVNLELDPDRWLPDLIVKATDLGLELVEALDLDDGYALLAPGSPLDELDDALRQVRRWPLGRHRRRWRAFDRHRLADQWQSVTELIGSRLDWPD